MTFALIEAKDRKISIDTILHGVGRAGSDQEFRHNLRLVAAVLLARHAEHSPHDAVHIAMTEAFVKDGRVKVDETGIWMCTYVGFERVTSPWGKERGFSCVICTRMTKFDIKMRELTTHTVQVYF